MIIGQREELVVLRHRHVVQVLWNLRTRDDTVEIVGSRQIAAFDLGQAAVAGQHSGDLPRAVGAKIEHDTDIVVADHAVRMAVLICNYERHNKFIRDAVVIALL